MPTTNRASLGKAIAEAAGPPVSGRAEALAVALADALADALAEGLAVDDAVGLAVGLASPGSSGSRP